MPSGAPNAPSAAATPIAPWNAATLAASESMSAALELAAREQPARQRVLRKFAHLHRVLERRLRDRR